MEEEEIEEGPEIDQGQETEIDLDQDPTDVEDLLVKDQNQEEEKDMEEGTAIEEKEIKRSGLAWPYISIYKSLELGLYSISLNVFLCISNIK